MTLCEINNCNYHKFGNTNLCSFHDKLNKNDKKIISIKQLFDKYDLHIRKYIITKSQGNNIFNLIKNFSDDDKIIKVIRYYLKSIEKKFIDSNLALKIVNNKTINFNKIYPLVGDYWNIDSKHNSAAICYYNFVHDLTLRKTNELILLNNNLLKPKLPFSFKNNYLS